MPKKRKPTTAMTIARLKRVQAMGRELELKLNVVQKDVERLMDHWEHIPHGHKRSRRRRRP
jgi:hypothetical protein